MSSSRRLLTLFLTILAAALLAAGCGGDDDGGSSDTGDSGGDSGSQTSDAGGGVDGKALFSSTCGSCHALSDAGTTGSVGPSLDGTSLDAAAIEAQIASGGGAMPPNLLQGEEATAVAEYVAGAAG